MPTRISAKARKDFENRLKFRYGAKVAALALILIKTWAKLDSTTDLSMLMTVDRMILTGTDQELKEFRDANASICTTLGVAGAVFTQVAITALSLPQIDSVHWSVKGLLVIALSYGFFCVLAAVAQQALLTSWLDAKQVRTELAFKRFDPASNEWINGVDMVSVMRISSPARMLNWPSFAFFLALAVYFGTKWTYGGVHEPGPFDDRNVFICFICCISTEAVISFHGGFIQGYYTGDEYEPPLDDEEDTVSQVVQETQQIQKL